MSDPREKLDRLLDVVEAYHRASVELAAFAPWPDDLRWTGKPAAASPVIRHLRDWFDDRPTSEGALHRAIKAAAPVAAWQQTYTVEEVGEDYIENYAYFELFGPFGHYHSAQARGFICYWGPGLFYDWHVHEAEEIYAVVSGDAVFRSEGCPDMRLGPGRTHPHAPCQRHAIRVRQNALVVYAVWKGPGMDGRARLERDDG